MTQAIFKYILPTLERRQSVEMPVGSRILAVHQQHGKITLWAIVAPEATRVRRNFRVLETGDDVDVAETLTYVGTVFFINGASVWHVFDAGMELA